MARPVNADAEQTRQRILDAAAQLFATRGVGNTSVRSIAGEAGVNAAMISHYFGGKDGLYRACMEAMYQELVSLRAALVDSAAQGGGLDAVIDRLVRTGYRFAREHQVPIRLIMRSVVATGRVQPDWRETALVPFMGSAAELLGQMLERPGHTLRLPFQSIVFLIARYALADPEELAIIAGLDPDIDDRADLHAAVESHLGDIANALFLGPTPDPGSSALAGAS